MITLPHHVEFLSDAWLAEAKSWLEREVAERKTRLSGPFSISGVFTDAPPHLNLPGNVASWQASFDGDSISVVRGANENADCLVEGDYQTALTMAQHVGLLAPGAREHMWREARQMFGKDCVRVKGAIAGDEARMLLTMLHDHMGTMTVENPDLHHRAARQGLLDKVREMEENGYTIIENAISDDFADEIREAVFRATAPYHRFALQWMLYHGREFELLAQHPQLMTLIDASLGRGAVIGSLSAIIRGTGPGAIPMHTDYAHVPEPYPEFAMTGVGVWAFEDWTAASGPTVIVPGSHKMRRAPRPGEGLDRGVPVEMPKGSVVFFTHGVWHWQGDRTEPGERVTLHWHFNRGILRSLEPKKVDPQMMARNAPRLGEMLGEDDWFDKMHGVGRDYGRLDYMNKLHAFTHKQKALIMEGSGETLRAAE